MRRQRTRPNHNNNIKDNDISWYSLERHSVVASSKNKAAAAALKRMENAQDASLTNPQQISTRIFIGAPCHATWNNNVASESLPELTINLLELPKRVCRSVSIICCECCCCDSSIKHFLKPIVSWIAKALNRCNKQNAGVTQPGEEQLLVVPNSNLTRPGNWKYDNTTLGPWL